MKKIRLLSALTGLCLLVGLPALVWGEEPQSLQPEEAGEVQEAETGGYAGLDTGSSSNEISGDQTILDQIYLESVELSGLNQEEALQAADKRMEEITGYQILLHMDDQTVGVTAGELGVSGANAKMIAHAAEIGQAGNVIKRYKVQKDLQTDPIQLPMRYQADKETIRAVLEQSCVPLNRETVNYGLTRDNGEFQVTNGVRGVTLKEEESVELVEDYLTRIWKDGVGSLDLEVEVTEPKGSQEELVRVKDVLGKCNTDYSASSADRATNIKNGTKLVNGQVLYPGDTISIEKLMVPFTEENGYALAASYSNGAVVESFGGGICQVSTTLYLAVLRAELEVTERHNHSMIVNYVKPSMDAAIAEGAKDFKFRNNLEAPVYIEGYAAGGNLSFVIYGEEYRPEGREVSFESETLETIEATTELVAAADKALGSIEQIQGAHTGSTARLWKVVKDENGEETRTEINNSTYQMSPNKYKVGVKTDNAEASGAIYSAIEKNDLNQVYIVLNTYT